MIITDYFIEYYASGFIQVYFQDFGHPEKELYVDVSKNPGDGHGGGLDTHVTTTTSYLTMDDGLIFSYQRIKPKK